MILTDRTKLKRLMRIQEVTQRQLAEAAGWSSHSYLGRLLRGQAIRLEPEPALKIARFLGVGVDDLFLTKGSTVSPHITHRNAS